MAKIILVQPFLTSYRMWWYENFDNHELTVLFSEAKGKSEGFNFDGAHCRGNVKFVKIKTFYPFSGKNLQYQAGIIEKMVRNRPDAVIIFANIRYLSFWTTLIVGRLLGIAVYPHGHGLFKKPNANLLFKLIYYVIGALCRKYVSYTESVAKSLANCGFPDNKIAVADNAILNADPVEPSMKSGLEIDILFLGRLRERCDVDVLVSAVAQVRSQTGRNIKVHIIGDGILRQSLIRRHNCNKWVLFYGAVYSSKMIAEVSRSCRYGVYPGASGLSVVHYMSLSLPPIAHNKMWQHEGPEASYIVDGVNGYLFDRTTDHKGLAVCLIKALNNANHSEVVRNSFLTYKKLVHPTLSHKFSQIISDC